MCLSNNCLQNPFSSICSYAEVRAEQRRELGIEEANPEVSADKVRTRSSDLDMLMRK